MERAETKENPLNDIRLYVDNELIPVQVHAGQHVRFLFLPAGNTTTERQIKPVAKATLENDDGRVINVSWLQPGGLLRKRIVTRHAPLLRRMRKVDGVAVYRIDDCIGRLEFLD